MTQKTKKIVESRKAKYNLYCIYFNENDLVHVKLRRACIKETIEDKMTVVVRNLTQQSSREFNMTDDEIILSPKEMNSIVCYTFDENDGYYMIGIFDKETKCKNAFKRYLNKKISKLNDEIDALNVVYEKVFARDMDKIHV